MSQFESHYDAPEAEVPRTSKLAVTALIFSLIFFCPLTTLIGPLLGLVALAKIGSNPNRKGKGLAVAAILIGVVLTAAWVFVGTKGYGYIKQSIAVVMAGPRDALDLGTSGDVAGFKASFHGAGATAPDAEARAFLDALESRYGAFQGSRFDEANAPPPQPGQTMVEFPYVLDFANGSVQSRVQIIFADPQSGTPGMINKLGYIVVEDPDAGDLRYPASP